MLFDNAYSLNQFLGYCVLAYLIGCLIGVTVMYLSKKRLNEYGGKIWDD